MKRIFCFIFFFISFNSVIFAQFFERSVAVSTNIALDLVNEYNISIDYFHNRRHTIALSLGLMHHNGVFDPSPISSSQNEFPGTVYSGYDARLSYSYTIYIRKTKALYYKHYIGAGFLYKSLTYNNIDFTDESGKGGSVNYTRNEKASILGSNIVYGLNIDFKKRSGYKHLMVNPFIGAGYDFRTREIETLSLTDHDYKGSDAPKLGNETKNQNYFTLILGLKIGLHICNYPISFSIRKKVD